MTEEKEELVLIKRGEKERTPRKEEDTHVLPHISLNEKNNQQV